MSLKFKLNHENPKDFTEYYIIIYTSKLMFLDFHIYVLQEILQQIKVKNLDTGEEMDLGKAEDQLPQSINPLSLHIMRLTSEYVRYVTLCCWRAAFQDWKFPHLSMSIN